MAERFGRQRGDWMKLRLGDRVRDRTDERHEGTVEAILQGYYVKVKWDNGWISQVRLADLEKILK
jgi:hypothetical protein